MHCDGSGLIWGSWQDHSSPIPHILTLFNYKSKRNTGKGKDVEPVVDM